MNADQIAAIRPAIEEALAGAPDTCATFEAAGAPDKWVQFVNRTLNAAYPLREDPAVVVSALSHIASPPSVSGWEGGKFATFDFPLPEPAALAIWIDAYFMGVLGCESDYSVEVAMEIL